MTTEFVRHKLANFRSNWIINAKSKHRQQVLDVKERNAFLLQRKIITCSLHGFIIISYYGNSLRMGTRYL